MSLTPEISVVVPVYNEVDNLPELHRQLTAALTPLGRPYELLLVDDGSHDGSREVLQRLAAEDPAVVALLFRRNFGQTAAMQAGFDHARGALIIPLDADLQNDPADIPRLLAKLDEGYDIVCGWRANRQEGALRKVPSRLANRLLVRVTGVDIHDTGCTLKVFRRETLEPVRLYGQLHRFIPAIASAYGARITELPVTHHPRRFGESKYGIGRTTKVILDLMLVKFLLASLCRPIHAFGRWALLSWALSLGSGLVGLLAGSGQWLLAALIFLTLGAQLIGTGIVAELLTRVYHEGTGRRTYRLAAVLGRAEES
ncbi:MAG: glycosyltransferase family 2 protein [Fimbriimonadaceae bacterium]|nr:glycosyltransferase family 2 protein [Fimbriimonadaceae bacterium]